MLAHVANPVGISTGGGSFTLTLLKDVATPLSGVKCYLFSEAGAYLGENNITSGSGEVSFNLADGDYKIRIDYMGYQFWTPVYSIPDIAFLEYTIDHQDVTIAVRRDYDGYLIPTDQVNVYLFNTAGKYLGTSQVTDNLGQAVFNLPRMDYQVRADYLRQQFWSSTLNANDETVVIEDGIADVLVEQSGSPLEGVSVYVFNASGSYLGINGPTDVLGKVSFRLPEGDYKFRADHQASQYWATAPVTAHQVNDIQINAGGGAVTLTVQKAAGEPLINVPVYVFSSAGSYMGLSQHTDAEGRVSFNLADGDYQFRADYLGYQFWGNTLSVPTTLSDVLTIAHQDVTITIESLYQPPADLRPGVKVYLFNQAGSYQGIHATTDSQGQAVFNLPAQTYKVRADYLGQQFWSDNFLQTDTIVTIDHGRALVHVIKEGMDVQGASVYLFTASGSYLGRSETTDSIGMAVFDLPDKQYKFRVDYSGTQYWSDIVSILPFQESTVDLNLDLLSLNQTNNPNPKRFDGHPPKYQPQRIMLASSAFLPGLLAQSTGGRTTSEQIYYYINDHLGTPQKMIDQTNSVVWAADYLPFGNANVTINTQENNFRFPGQFFDNETGLHYNWHRYYDPKLGRYLRADPIGLAGGINLFVYSYNNPTNLIDPYGLFCRIEGVAGIGPQVGDTWFESQKVGYGAAFLKRIAWELFKLRYVKNMPPIPDKIENKSPIFRYRVRYTEYERRLIITNEFYVCYDDCSGEQTSREPIGPSNFGKMQVNIVGAYEVDKYIGDSKEYNSNINVDPLVIHE